MASLRTSTLAVVLVALATGAATARAAQPDAGAGDEFVLQGAGGAAKAARGAKESKIQATKTEAAMKFFVVDKDKGPVRGVVISLAAPDGKKYYAEETDADGYAEVLVPVGQKYDLVYLSLAQRNIATNVTVTDEPNQSIRLTLRYKAPPAPPPLMVQAPPAQRFILMGVEFDTAKATLRHGSTERLDYVVDFMTHKPSARLEISGHTDNVGNKKDNKKLSQQRADAVRDYLVSKGIDASRVQTVGYGDERPIASNATPEGRQQNRRIEAAEL